MVQSVEDVAPLFKIWSLEGESDVEKSGWGKKREIRPIADFIVDWRKGDRINYAQDTVVYG